MDSLTVQLLRSWATIDGKVNTTDDLFTWINTLNKTTYVNIKESSLEKDGFWFYDEAKGQVINRNGSFFSIEGVRYYLDGKFVSEQPIINQPEIGYLGIIVKKIDGILHFLMQAKIEPGNVNCVQISPTIQATKSNFTCAHGGRKPLYLEYFVNADKYKVIYDQVQSEQATRFLKKRNRNIMILVDEDVEVYENFRWMTLGQIKRLMEVDNLVNMDTRTVLSGLPFIAEKLTAEELGIAKALFHDEALYRSIFETDALTMVPMVFQKMNNYKMFHEVSVDKIRLEELSDWNVHEAGIVCKEQADYMVQYYDIEIEGREVRRWTQPLFKAIGVAEFGLITKNCNGTRKFLVRLKPEIGNHDILELGPSIQWEPTHSKKDDNEVDKVFREYIERKKGVMCDVILSEEGGRFYHEQNRNVVLEIEVEELTEIPEDYMWVDYSTLNYLVQMNNCLNIQLRNLMSLLKI